MTDLAITGGTLIDGSGSAPFRADIAVKGDTIAEIGMLPGIEAKSVIDASGKIVCPGFIDAHSHSDAYLLLEPSAESKVFQGISTEITGNCGASAAPISRISDLPSDWRDKDYPAQWQTFAEYLDLLRQARPAVNVFPLAGHGRIRSSIMGAAGRQAVPEEIKRMCELLAQCMDQGAKGMSTGLIYSPGINASAGELRALCESAGKKQGVYSSHMRSESGRLLDALDETIAMAGIDGLAVQVSHLKAAGRSNWPLARPALERIAAARERGLRVAADAYPYTAANTELDITLPAWAAEGGTDAALERLGDPTTRDRIRREIIESRPQDYWDGVIVASTLHPGNARFTGMTVSQAGAALDAEPVEAALRIMETDRLRTTAFFFGISEENMKLILAAPFVMLGTDASLRAMSGQLSNDHPHPRAFGAFPRFLRMALDGETVPVQEAVRKMTSLPAAHFGIRRRGLLARGMFADIAIFDPKSVGDAATYAEPRRLATGLCALIVNGRIALDGNGLTGRRSGIVL